MKSFAGPARGFKSLIMSKDPIRGLGEVDSSSLTPGPSYDIRRWSS